jgi:GNAT superfamily N-acetyltransferase
MLKFKIPESEEDFSQYYRLRWEVLRKPWGGALGTERADDDDQSIHGMMTDENGLVIAVSRLHFNSEIEGQIRFMGVHEEYQGKGVGMQLLMEMEKIALAKGIKQIRLHARENAVPFYEKANYTLEQKSYLLFGEIQHFEMLKIISK